MRLNNWSLFFAVVVLDQLSKKIVLSRPEWAEEVITNSGLPFIGETATGIFSLAAVIVGLAFFLFFYWFFLNEAKNKAALALIMGGAVSNLIDRLFRGGVIDFLDIGLQGKFNLADAAIWAGIAFLLYNLVKESYESPVSDRK